MYQKLIMQHWGSLRLLDQKIPKAMKMMAEPREWAYYHAIKIAQVNVPRQVLNLIHNVHRAPPKVVCVFVLLMLLPLGDN